MPRARAGGRELRHKFPSQHGEARQWSAQRPALPSLILLVPMDTRWSDPPMTAGHCSQVGCGGGSPWCPPSHPADDPWAPLASGASSWWGHRSGHWALNGPTDGGSPPRDGDGYQGHVTWVTGRGPSTSFMGAPPLLISFHRTRGLAVGEPSPNLSALYSPGSLASVPIVRVSGWDHIRTAEGPDQTSWGLWWWRKGVRAPKHPGEGGTLAAPQEGRLLGICSAPRETAQEPGA